MITLVKSAKSRFPKNESGSRRKRSAMEMRLRALSWYTTVYVARYSHICVTNITTSAATMPAT